MAVSAALRDSDMCQSLNAFSWRCAGKPPQHKLLPVEARQQFVYEKHASAEAALWEEEFHEPLAPNVKSVLSAPKPTLQRPPLH